MRQNLSDRTIRALKPADKGKRYEIRDAIVPQLSVRVTDSGSKSFTLSARFPPSKNATRRAIGSYPAVELAVARQTARDWLALVAKGIDPAAQVEEVKAAAVLAAKQKQDRSCEATIARFLAERRAMGLRKAHEDEVDFKREVLPRWTGRDVSALSMADVMEVVQPIRDRGKVTQPITMAKKLAVFLAWCEEEELIERSPYRPKKIAKTLGQKPSRERVLSDVEIAAFWTATAEVTGSPAYCPAYRLLLVLGQRLNDVCQLKWSEIDLERRLIVIKAERYKMRRTMKAATSAGRDHTVPLPELAVDILASVRRWPNCDWVLSPNGKRPITIRDDVKDRIDARMSEIMGRPVEPWINHDLRRTVRTKMGDLGVLDEIAEACVGHVPKGLIGVYNRSDRLVQKLAAFNAWEADLRRIVGLESLPSNVVQLKR